MKKVSLVLGLIVSTTVAFAGPIKTVEDGNKPIVPGKEPAMVKTYRERLVSAGLTAYKAEGLGNLARSNPEVTTLITSSGKKLGEGEIQTNIKADLKFFEEAAGKADVSASTAAEARADMTLSRSLGPNASKVVQAMEAGAISLLPELAQAGPKANKEKAIAVLDALASTSVNTLRNEADSAAKIAEIESKLGNKVTIDDFIKKCLELMKR